MSNLLGLLWALYVILTIVMMCVMIPTMVQDICVAPQNYRARFSIVWVVFLLLLVATWPIVLIFTWWWDRRKETT